MRDGLGLKLECLTEGCEEDLLYGWVAYREYAVFQALSMRPRPREFQCARCGRKWPYTLLWAHYRREDTIRHAFDTPEQQMGSLDDHIKDMNAWMKEHKDDIRKELQDDI